MAMLEERGVPLVQLNRRAAGATQSVIADDEAGVTLALRHLHELGHRRIGYIVGKARYDTTERRVRAYRTFSKEQGLANSGLIYRGSLAPARLRMGIAKLLDRPVHERPTALLAINLQAAVQLLTALRELGLRVPEDLSVMGFDDGPLAEHLWPPLTTIWMPREAMGKKAVEVLLSLLGHHDVPDTIMVEAAPEFIERASTAPVMPSSNH
jgi:DNA-binding LacI/PurR family transcriptional regulator